LLARQAAWSKQRGDMRPGAALRRFTSHGLNRLVGTGAADTRLLAG
jgi:hypothetical protein